MQRNHAIRRCRQRLCNSVPQRDRGFRTCAGCASRRFMSSPVSSPRPISTSAGPGRLRRKHRAAPTQPRRLHRPLSAARRDYRAVSSNSHPTSALVRHPFAHVSGHRFTTKAGYAKATSSSFCFNPPHPRPMRALANHMLPRHHVAYNDFSLRRAAPPTRGRMSGWPVAILLWFDACICGRWDTACRQSGTLIISSTAARISLATHSTRIVRTYWLPTCANMPRLWRGGMNAPTNIRRPNRGLHRLDHRAHRPNSTR